MSEKPSYEEYRNCLWDCAINYRSCLEICHDGDCPKRNAASLVPESKQGEK